MSQVAGEEMDVGSMISKAVGRCPEAVVRLGYVEIRCLLDTGAQGSFFRRSQEGELVDVSSYIRISGVNSIDMPYLGYFERTVRPLQESTGRCRVAVIRLGYAEIRCILDTGAQGSTGTESFFRRSQEGELVDVSSYIRISGANGLDGHLNPGRLPRSAIQNQLTTGPLPGSAS